MINMQRMLGNAEKLPNMHVIEILNPRGEVMARLHDENLDALRKRAERFAKGQGWVTHEA